MEEKASEVGPSPTRGAGHDIWETCCDTPVFLPPCTASFRTRSFHRILPSHTHLSIFVNSLLFLLPCTRLIKRMFVFERTLVLYGAVRNFEVFLCAGAVLLLTQRNCYGVVRCILLAVSQSELRFASHVVRAFASIICAVQMNPTCSCAGFPLDRRHG